jgi:excisionase family DNA binding protein
MPATREDFARAFARELARELRADPTPKTDWLTPTEAAEYLKLKPRALEHMRGQGRGPRFFKAGRLVRYRLADLDLWLKEGGR